MTKTKPKKTTGINIRLTPSEHLHWQLLAHSSGLSVSELIRTAMGKVRTWTAPDRELEKEKIRQLARIGNNLNQIARWANTYKSAAEEIEVVSHLVAIELALSSLSTFSPLGDKNKNAD
jgi:Bacterial mobilisation protein (MobC)